MKKSILYSAIVTATAIGIGACSSGTDVAGIGGSGVTSSGTIDGFGSIFVNGVEFETGSSTISIDGNPGSESDLAIGMRVTVTGTLNDDGVTGTASSVSFDDDLQGPIGTISENLDGTVKTIEFVVGRTVKVSSTNTSFDVSGTLAGVTFDYDTISSGQYVEISGYLDSNGVMIASRVELKDTVFDPTSDLVEVRGTISMWDPIGETFTLEGTTNLIIDTSSNPTIDSSLSGGIADGVFVEVKGNCTNSSCTTVVASEIEDGLERFDDNDDVEIEGIVTRYVSDSDFDVNGFPVDASNATTREPASLVIALNKEIEVEGTIVNGVLIASEIEDEGGEIKIAATVAAGSINESTETFDLEPVFGQTITVKIDNSTEIEDEFDAITNVTTLFANLNDGDYVVVEGYDDGGGTIIASEFKRKPAEDVILQGRLEQIDQDTSVTVLGVSFQIEDVAETDFEDAADNDITQTTFIAAAPVGTLIKIKDKAPANGVADEVEIED